MLSPKHVAVSESTQKGTGVSRDRRMNSNASCGEVRWREKSKRESSKGGKEAQRASPTCPTNQSWRLQEDTDRTLTAILAKETRTKEMVPLWTGGSRDCDQGQEQFRRDRERDCGYTVASACWPCGRPVISDLVRKRQLRGFASSERRP